MGKTLFDCTRQLATVLGVATEGTATGGSTTTVLDSVERTEADDYWNGGTAWIYYDAGGASAAPQGEYGYISDFATSGGTITLRTALTAAVAVGDKYTIATKRYPLQVLIQKINEVMGVIEKRDITTITTADSQLEYTLPSDLWQLKSVRIQNDTESDINDWQAVHDYRVLKSATGTANKLSFVRQPASSMAVELVYLAYPSELMTATGKLDDSFHIEKVVYNAAVGCLIWRKAKVGESDPSLNDLLNYFQALAQKKDAERPVEYPKKQAQVIHPTFSRP